MAPYKSEWVAPTWLDLAVAEIRDQHNVNVTYSEDTETIRKFGSNLDVDTTPRTVMTLPSGVDHETYVNDNLIDTISSSSAADTQPVTIVGTTITDGKFTRHTQSATLDGQNKVAITPIARVDRSRVIAPASTNLAGDVYIYEDTAISAGVPTDDTKVHLIVPNDDNQSFKAALTVPDNQWLAVHRVTASVLRRQTASVDFRIQVREPGSVFETKGVFAASSPSPPAQLTFQPLGLVPPNSDVRVVADSSTANTAVTAVFTGIFLTITT